MSGRRISSSVSAVDSTGAGRALPLGSSLGASAFSTMIALGTAQDASDKTTPNNAPFVFTRLTILNPYAMYTVHTSRKESGPYDLTQG
jgi:hypothetical protein